MSRILLHSSKTDLKTGLKLQSVVELPSAQAYQLGTKVVHARDQFLCDLHEEFLGKVDAKVYRGSEWSRFLEDKQLDDDERLRQSLNSESARF